MSPASFSDHHLSSIIKCLHQKTRCHTHSDEERTHAFKIFDHLSSRRIEEEEQQGDYDEAPQGRGLTSSSDEATLRFPPFIAKLFDQHQNKPKPGEMLSGEQEGRKPTVNQLQTEDAPQVGTYGDVESRRFPPSLSSPLRITHT